MWYFQISSAKTMLSQWLTTSFLFLSEAKTVKYDLGLFDLDIPRDREGSFEPQIVKKHQTDISRLESSIIGMYAKGMSTRDIATQVNEIELAGNHIEPQNT